LTFRLSQAHKFAYSFCCTVMFCVLGSSSPAVYAQEVFGVVELSQGSVRIVGAKGESRLAQVQDKVLEGDTIISGPSGEMQIRTEDHGFVAVRPNTKLRIDAYAARSDANDKTVMSLLEGTIRSITGWIGKTHPEAYAIKTPSATIGIRGTDHEPHVILPPEPGQQAIGEPGTYEKVNQGSTVVQGEKGSVPVQANQAAFAAHDRAVAPRTLDAIPAFYKPSRFENRIERRKEALAQNMVKHQQNRTKQTGAVKNNRQAGEAQTPKQLRERKQEPKGRRQK
jgi:hypothetical protein